MKNNRARSFVMIMIIISISALLLRIAIERIIKINITQNESSASNALKLIAAALDNYASDHLGAYPTSISVLTHTTPPYLDKDYISQDNVRGYYYSCPHLESSGYSCSAIPVKCRLTGNTNYSITTGGALTSEECKK